MNKIVFFNKTVRGHLHKLRDIPCEDYSDSFSDPDGRYYIAVIADGHGDKACFRSSTGSKAVVEATVAQLKDLAWAILREDPEETSLPLTEQMKYPKGIQMIMRGLTDRIIAKWYQTIRNDLSDNPPTDEEYHSAGDREASYRAGEHLEHIYGTTVIAALWVADYLILLHQGDGRCDVFYDDGTVDQPIPWDVRCHENVTTSMCDADADVSFRHCVIDMSKKKVVACFLGSDGVEDSFPDPDGNQSGTHYFYRKLAVTVKDMDKADIEAYLEDYLPGFSEDGSGDDVSVAALVDTDAICPLLPEYSKTVFKYEIDSRVRTVDEKLISMQRKHGILQRRALEAQTEAADSEKAAQSCRDQIDRLSKELAELEEQKTAAFSAMQAQSEESGKAREYLEQQESSEGFMTLIKFLGNGFNTGLHSLIEDACHTKAKEYESVSERASAKAAELETAEAELGRLAAAEEAAQEHLRQAQAEFETYDAEYQRLSTEKQKLLSCTNEDPS